MVVSDEILIQRTSSYNSPFGLCDLKPGTTKQCKLCKRTLPLSDFGRNGYRSRCKDCTRTSENNRKHQKGFAKPYNENKSCSVYLGAHVAEQLLSNVFTNVKRMPMCNKGYDFICGKGYKVDVKAACTQIERRKYKSGEIVPITRWQFIINRNNTPDYFALIAFDNRASLTPLHFWMVPGSIICDKLNIMIFPTTFHKWKSYEQPLDKIQIGCTTMKNGDE